MFDKPKARAALMFGSVVLAAVLFIWLPSLKTTGKSPCVVNLEMIERTKSSWMKQHPNEIPTWDNLRDQFGSRLPVCPQGGTYALGPAGENPKCSVGGRGHAVGREK